jgi:hypothetical protein
MPLKSPPWKRPRPKGLPKTKLTPEQKERAKARAKRAGRRYPNLIDNMFEASKSSRRKK